MYVFERALSLLLRIKASNGETLLRQSCWDSLLPSEASFLPGVLPVSERIVPSALTLLLQRWTTLTAASNQQLTPVKLLWGRFLCYFFCSSGSDRALLSGCLLHEASTSSHDHLGPFVSMLGCYLEPKTKFCRTFWEFNAFYDLELLYFNH